MATEQIAVSHTNGKTVFFRFYDIVQDKRFDFNDNTYQTSPVNEKLAATEQTEMGDANQSLYTASIDLSLLNSTRTTAFIIVQAVDDLATDEVILSFEMKVTNGKTGDDVAYHEQTQSMIEVRFGEHTWSGNFFYVDPVNGATHASGARGGRGDPYAGVQDCHDNAITTSNHDVIILLAGDTTHPTTLTEDVTISKDYVSIMGPGRDFLWTRSGAGNTITITANGVKLSGFQLETAATGSGNGIDITAVDHIAIDRVSINNTRGDGIHILRGNNCIIENCEFTDTGQSGAGQGVDILGTAGTSNDNIIRCCIFRDTSGDAIQISAGTTNDTSIYLNQITGSSGWGVNISSSAVDTVVRDNTFGQNSSGPVNDGGTTSTIKRNVQWAAVGDAMTLATNAITDAVIATDAIDDDAIATGAIAATAFAAGAIDAAAIANGAIDAATFAASAINAAAIADDAITASKLDETTNFPVAKTDTGSTEIARTGADSDTLETLSDQMDAIGAIIGDGAIVVNHDSGGTDNLAYKTSGGAGIDNAVVRGYLKVDYDAGDRGTAFIKGTANTNVNGRWENDMMLDAETYTFAFEKQGVFQVSTQEFTVS